jgi:hypothetical protein
VDLVDERLAQQKWIDKIRGGVCRRTRRADRRHGPTDLELALAHDVQR